MKKEKFFACRNEILALLKKNGVEKWNAARILSSALNELIIADGEQAVVVIRPLLAYPEAGDKI